MMDFNTVYVLVFLRVSLIGNKRIDKMPFGAVRDTILYCMEAAIIINPENAKEVGKTIFRQIIEKYNVDALDMEILSNMCAEIVREIQSE